MWRLVGLLLGGSLFTVLGQGSSVYGGDSSPRIEVIDANWAIRFQLVNKSNLNVRFEAPASASIIVSQAEIPEGSTLSQVLVARGIYPCTDTFSLIYDVNPYIYDLESVPRGEELKLPRLSFAGATQIDTNAVLAVPIMNSEHKLSIKTNSEQFLATLQRFATNSPELWVTSEQIIAINRLRDSVVLVSGLVAANSRPISKRILIQIGSECALANSTLSYAVQHRHLDEKDWRILHDLSLDFELRRGIADGTRGVDRLPTRWPDQLVRVDVRRANSDVLENHYRVYYQPSGLYEKFPRDTQNGLVEEFWPSTTNAISRVPLGQFHFWAEPEDRATGAQTEARSFSVQRESGPLQKIDLLIRPAK